MIFRVRRGPAAQEAYPCVCRLYVSANAFLCIGGCDADCRSRGVHGAVPCRYRAEQAAGFPDGYDVGRTGGNCVPVTGKDTLRLRRGSKPAGGSRQISPSPRLSRSGWHKAAKKKYFLDFHPGFSPKTPAYSKITCRRKKSTHQFVDFGQRND